jgi:polyferredoxin
MAFAGAAIILSPVLPAQSLQGLAAGTVNTSVLKGVTVVALLILVDVGLFRHTFCEWLCIMGWWQRLFAGRGALRVRFDLERARECTRCTDCKSACFMGIEPRRRDLPGTCLNCGECVKACNRRMAPFGSPSLIRYAFPAEAGMPGKGSRPAVRLQPLRLAGYALLLAAFAVAFAYSVSSRSPVQIKVRQVSAHALTVTGEHAQGEYAIDLYSTGNARDEVLLSQVGLPPQAVVIAPNPVPVPAGGRAEAILRFTIGRGELQPGRNSFTISATEPLSGAAGASQRVTFGLPAFSP